MKRRYRIQVDGRAHAIDIEDLGGSNYRVSAEGRSFDVVLDGSDELSLAEIAPHMAVPGSTPGELPRPAVTPPAAHRAQQPAHAPLNPRAPAPAAMPHTAGGAAADVLAAPMPGVILRVLVAPGTPVQRGQDIAVLEAMKMENMLRAPRQGTVTEVLVQPGQQVAHGHPIVRFGPAGTP